MNDLLIHFTLLILHNDKVLLLYVDYKRRILDKLAVLWDKIESPAVFFRTQC